MLISNYRSAQQGSQTITTMVEAYKGSSAYIALSEGSKTEYRKPLERIVEMGLAMPNDVAYAQARSRSPIAFDRSHINFWETKIMASDISNYQKGRLILFVKMVYRSQGLGNLVEGLKLPVAMRHTRGEAHPLTKEMVALVQSYPFDRRLERYAVLIVFQFYTGMRPKEVRDLKWEHVDEIFINVVGSKDREAGVVSRKIPILPEVQWCLDYCKGLKGKWVFVGETRSPLNKDTVCAKVHEIFSELDFKGTLYDARRGLVTEMIRSGYTLLQAAGIAGHRSTKTTERYVRMSMDEKASQFKGFKC